MVVYNRINMTRVIKPLERDSAVAMAEGADKPLKPKNGVLPELPKGRFSTVGALAELKKKGAPLYIRQAGASE
jgi:hypothetical protein